MTPEQKILMLEKILALPNTKDFDCMDIRLLMTDDDHMTHIDHHPISAYLDQLHRIGILTLTQGFGYCRYKKAQ